MGLGHMTERCTSDQGVLKKWKGVGVRLREKGGYMQKHYASTPRWCVKASPPRRVASRIFQHHFALHHPLVLQNERELYKIELRDCLCVINFMLSIKTSQPLYPHKTILGFDILTYGVANDVKYDITTRAVLNSVSRPQSDTLRAGALLSPCRQEAFRFFPGVPTEQNLPPLHIHGPHRGGGQNAAAVVTRPSPPKTHKWLQYAWEVRFDRTASTPRGFYFILIAGEFPPFLMPSLFHPHFPGPSLPPNPLPLSSLLIWDDRTVKRKRFRMVFVIARIASGRFGGGILCLRECDCFCF
ncbi:hypothetical protein CEXT_776611 [Caerostris extrusa]|uniref:Uncharacterized protein n=1 Tax=Caerostris extrusa TaxID=172846 RepID=A0AAV4WFJ7_CAEEX|nr:hypothetical protein CEXT_776611 [Caerostris extrusa]